VLDWQAVQDDVVITHKKADWQVWNRSQLFGCPALSYALERLIDDLTKGGIDGGNSDVLGLGYEVD
jgi:hypothetical protein